MLQTSPIQTEITTDFEQFLSPSYYWGLVKRRFIYFLLPVLLIAPAGMAIVMWLPALYRAEGKILVESQRIPMELVRPTVTSLAAERIQIMKQRLLTRDNMMAIVDKYKLFSDRRNLLSSSEIVDLMRERTKIEPTELGARVGTDRVTMALTVGYEHEQPEVAAKVAGELITLFLNEDLRNRSARATETTQFLAREAGRLQNDLRSVEKRLADYRATRSDSAKETFARQQAEFEQANMQLATLRAERLKKANQLSWNHPDVQAVQRKIIALERVVSTPPVPATTVQTPSLPDPALEALEAQQASVQKSYEGLSEKLAAARMGEALERDQQAEKFEVIEQPALPQEPIKPKRIRLLALVLGLSIFAGAGLAAGTELLDKTIRSRADLSRLVEGHLIIPIPWVITRRDRVRQRLKRIATVTVILALVAGAAAAAHLFLPPLDILWRELTVKIPRYLNR